jgi:ribosomal protein S18 acetylase RimI-like enzyme
MPIEGTLELQVAEVSDAERLVALVNSAYRGDSSRVGWTTEADLLGGQRVDAEGLRSAIATDGTVILVHEQAGEPIACVQLDRTGQGCYLGMLTIRPDLQAAGLGRRLLAAAERYARERWRSTYVHMTVIRQRRELIEWYERRGYRRTGVTKPFPYGDPRFGLPRRGDLEFLILEKTLP